MTGGVATWSSLRAAGVSPARIRAQLDAGRWRRWGSAIVAHNGPLTEEQRWLVARVHGGPHAVLTAFTAAEALGLTGWHRDEVHLLLGQGARVHRGCPVPIRVHRCRDRSSVATRGRLEAHVPADALVLAAATLSSPSVAAAVLAAGVQQRLVRPVDLTRALEARSRTRHRRLLLTATADIAQGAQALSEIDFVRLCRRHGMPAPRQQTPRRGPGGRRRYLDATWRRADGRLVVVEVDGALHLIPTRWWDDQLRQNEIALGGALVLRFPSIVVRTRPDHVVGQICRALRIERTTVMRSRAVDRTIA